MSTNIKSYKYSQSSKDRLETCHDDLQLIFKSVLLRADHTIICGHRGEKEQDDAFRRGVSRLPWPQGKHNEFPSMAVDAAPYVPGIGISWEDHIAFGVFAGRVLEVADRLFDTGQVTHRIRWGGDWDQDGSNLDQKFNDLVHFELTN